MVGQLASRFHKCGHVCSTISGALTALTFDGGISFPNHPINETAILCIFALLYSVTFCSVSSPMALNSVRASIGISP